MDTRRIIIYLIDQLIMAKILIIEDDLPLSQTLMNLLNRHHEAYHAISLSEAINKLKLQPFDLLIIDRQLPDGDGIEIIHYLQERSLSARTLILTQNKSLPDKIEGLEIGADEYLHKPFDYEELILRINHLLKIRKAKCSQVYRCGPITLDFDNRLVKIRDQEWNLRKKEAQILAYFIDRINQVVTREDLIYAIWSPEGKPNVNLRTIDVHLRRLRLRLGAYRHFLQSVHGSGYRFQLTP